MHARPPTDRVILLARRSFAAGPAEPAVRVACGILAERMAVLSELAVGGTAMVAAIDGDGPVVVRLLEMGFVPGTPVHLVKVAPFGDPLQFRVRGYHISLRRAEAANIRIEPT